MTKKILPAILFFITSLAMAQSLDLDIKSFQNSSLFDHVVVTTVEKVFSDDLEVKDLYKVTYEVEGDCSQKLGGHGCSWIPYCEYIWVVATRKNQQGYFMEGTDVSCDKDIEEVTKPQLIEP